MILQVRGAISPSGRIRGRLRYGDRGGCFTADAFAARFERGLAGHGARIFTLYGGDGSLPARQVPATRGAQLTVDVIGRHHRRVRRTYARARPGTPRLRLRGLVSGTYRVRITARAGRRVATASVPLRVR